MDKHVWLSRKHEFYERMLSDKEIGYLDPGIEGLLKIIFSIPSLFSTSSCSGRISLVDGEWHWERDSTRILYKKHYPTSVTEITSILSDLESIPDIWLHVIGPILHLNALNLETAFKILEIAREAGFKHSGILGCSNKGISIELMSGIQMSVPIKRSGRLLVTDDTLSILVDTANVMLKLGWERLKRLQNSLSLFSKTMV